MSERLIYLDNAATTFPKPPEVLERMVDWYSRLGVSPGRGSYDRTVEAAEAVDRARRKLARFFGAPDPDRVVFAANATDALNMAVQGMVSPGDHVVSTRLEHNSVLRPLYHLKEMGVIDYDLVPFDGRGFVDPADVERALRPNTRLVVVTHASNVLGTIQPVADIGAVCRKHGIPLLIDAAQSAGVVPMDMTAWGAGAIAFTGHKSLLGPTGIGGLVVSPDTDIRPTRFGGTGVDSLSPVHTLDYPFRLEAGTINTLGIRGLSAGLDFLERHGTAESYRREMELAGRLWEGLSALDKVTLYGSVPDDSHVPLLTCNVEGIWPTDVGTILDGDFGIAVRTGLHCAPLVHTDLGIVERGGVRFSLGYFNTPDDIEQAIDAMGQIAAEG